MNNLKCFKVESLPIVFNTKQNIIYTPTIGGKQNEVYLLEEDEFGCRSSDVYHKFGKYSNVLRVEYMFTQNKITLATTNSILVIDCDTKELVLEYEFDQKIEQVSWNNSHDLVAIVFKGGTISTFLLDMRYQLICKGEGNILSSVPQKEDVGWGSKTTQFQGPKRSDEVQLPGDHISPIDDLRVVISWRGNSEEFVVSYFHEGVRQFKVFDNVCKAKAISESREGFLNGPIAWKPQGNIIAVASYVENKNCISLFEKNGLFRSQICLVDLYYPITALSWSPCGRVLGVTLSDDNGQKHVCFYTTSNSRWYLKQHLVFSLENPLCTLTWIPTNPQCIELVVVTKLDVIQYTFKLEIDTDHKNNLVAVIDGKRICIHSFKNTVEPLPSCTHVVTLDNPINMLAFHPSKDLTAAIDSANNLYCFSLNGSELTILNQVFLSKPIFPLNINHLFWNRDNPQFIINKSPEGESDLYEFELSTSLLVKRHQFNNTAIIHVFAVDDTVITYNENSRHVLSSGETKSNLPFPLKVIPLSCQNEICCLHLTPQQELYLEDEFVCKGITSMLFYKGYLLLTDNTQLYTHKLHQHSIYTLPEEGLSEFHIRSLNEISHLVCMLGDSPNVVLSTPRGNLEIISCRPMEVRMVENFLTKGEWSEAIKLMKLTRMNWNLLIDLSPDRFYENLPKIVEECNSQNVLNAIVSEVNDENCLTTVYDKTVDIIAVVHLNKRKRFLENLCAFLDDSGTFTDYLPTVLKICVDRNNLKKAMAYTSFLLSSHNSELRAKADKALMLLKIHVESEDLFKAALLTFDVSLAHFVAQKCQMNPQEVEPILNELRNSNNLGKRLSVHLRYGNWEEAISYMIRSESLNKTEIMNFIKEHDVAKRAHSEAIKLKIPFKRDIAKLYVEKLICERRHSEAAVVLIQYALYDEAIDQFKLALDYQKCVEYLSFSSYTEGEKKSLFTDLAEKLIVMQRISEAASIYEDQLLDYQMAIKTLTQGKLFTDALRIAKKHSSLHVIDVYILPEMIDYILIIMEQVQGTAKEFKKYLERLKKLRNVRKYMTAQLKTFETGKYKKGAESTITSRGSFGSSRLLENDYNAAVINSDVQSIVSTESRKSLRSNVSTSSTMKQIRKLEKEKQDLTEGSRLEDIALMREMHIMISAIFKLGVEIRPIFLRLIEYSQVDLNALKHQQAKLLDLQELMKQEAVNIWTEEFRENSNSPHIGMNYTLIDTQFRTAPSEIQNPGFSWVLEILRK